MRIRDDEWNVYRRYAQFYALHKMLKKKDPIVNTFDFPPKKTIGKKVSFFLSNNLTVKKNNHKSMVHGCHSKDIRSSMLNFFQDRWFKYRPERIPS